MINAKAQPEAPDNLIDEFEFDFNEESNMPEFDASNAISEQRSIPSLLELDVPIPSAFRADQSHATPTSRPRRNAHAPVRYDSSE
jgi:hypothetical protein